MFRLAELKVDIKLWPKNNDTAKVQYIQKAMKSFACDEDTKACKKRLDRLAISIANLYNGNNYLHYFTQEDSNQCVVCGAAARIM